MGTRSLSPAIALALVLGIGCKDNDEPSGPSAPLALDAVGSGSVSGHLLGPDNTSLCHALPQGSAVQVHLLMSPPAAAAIAGRATVQCLTGSSDNSYSIAVANGTYMVRLILPPDPSIGLLPQRVLFPNPVAVAGQDVSDELRVEAGSGLAGGVTLDGAPLAGIGAPLLWAAAPGYLAVDGRSGADGGWMDAFGREPMILQKELRYQITGDACAALGTKLLQGPNEGSFLFPDELDSVNCTLTKAPAIAFSHVRTRLAVTPMPGDFGGLSPQLAGQFGFGWGAQFPAAPTYGPFSGSQLFRGGLVVALRPDRVLSGVDLLGYTDCSICRDFGLDGTLSYSRSGESGTRVLWRYSDAPSPNGVGLKVAQQSFDGVPPNNYVLFHLTFTNSRSTTVTFYAGMFADWDVDQQPGDNIGGSAQGGRIMYETDATPGGDYVGTLLLGNYPVSGNAFFTGPVNVSQAAEVSALDGETRTPTASTPGDQRYYHALGPITLNGGRSGDFWIALVAGQTRNQFFASASAASADVASRRSDTRSELAGLTGNEIRVQGSRKGSDTSNPAIKRNTGQ